MSDYPTLAADTTGITFHLDFDGDGLIDQYLHVDASDVGEDATFEDYLSYAQDRAETDGLDPCDIVKATMFTESAPETHFRFADSEHDHEDCEEDPDDFPEWQQDISNIVLYFDADADGESDYSVKVDGFDEGNDKGNDLDAYFDDLLDFVLSENPDLDESMLLGVSIKGGTQETQYYAVRDNENGEEADPDLAPEKLLNTGKGNNQTLEFSDFAAQADLDALLAAEAAEEEDLEVA